MIRTLLCLVFGPMFVVLGWNAWTGRWRSWAHPYSGAALFPLALLPLGLLVIGMAFADDPDELSGWEMLILAPGAIAFVLVTPLLGLTMFVHIKRIPAFLRPRWLPPEWEVPRFVDPRSVAISTIGGGVDPTSEDAAGMVAEGRKPVARWHVFHVDEDPAVPFLHQWLPGWRWCYLYVHDDLVVIAQRKREDRLHEAPFLLVFQPSDVKGITYVPQPRWSWRVFFYHLTHYPLPRLLIDTTSGPHHVAIIDRHFRRHVDRSLTLLEETLKVPVRRRAVRG